MTDVRNILHCTMYKMYLILDESQSILTASNISVTKPGYACFNAAASTCFSTGSIEGRLQFKRDESHVREP